MEIYVGEYNRESLDLKGKRIYLYDCTLRDGEQTPGVSFTQNEKLEIAKALDKLGIDVIEAGFPINSNPEFETVKKIKELGLKTKISGLARVIVEDIDACIKADVDIVHTFVSTSDLHLKYQMGKSEDEVYEMAVKAVEYIKKHGFKCVFSPMDATRSRFEYLLRVCKGAEEAGADYINVPDTVGVLHPPATRQLFSKLKGKIKVPLQAHAHNDFGLAVANSLAAVESGAEWVHVTVNGMGERAGNASLEQVAMSLHALYNAKTGIHAKHIYEVSQLVERYAETPLSLFTPIVGKNAFAHESGIHAHAVLKKASTFEPLKPEDVGQKRRIVIGKHSGKAAIEQALKDLGYEKLEKAQLVDITTKIKELAEKKKRIYDEDIVALAEDALGQGREKPIVTLDEVTVTTGNKIRPSASVVIKYDDVLKAGAAQGVGPVDAAANAIQSILGKEHDIKLVEFSLRAITGGTDALADVTVRIADKNGNVFSGNAVNSDIVMASVEAVLRAINRAVSYSRKK